MGKMRNVGQDADGNPLMRDSKDREWVQKADGTQELSPGSLAAENAKKVGAGRGRVNPKSVEPEKYAKGGSINGFKGYGIAKKV